MATDTRGRVVIDLDKMTLDDLVALLQRHQQMGHGKNKVYMHTIAENESRLGVELSDLPGLYRWFEFAILNKNYGDPMPLPDIPVVTNPH